MPKMTVYLPEDLYELVKERGMPVSELLQDAIRREVELEEKRAAADELVRELVREHGEPSARDVAWAEGLVNKGTVDKRTRRARRAG
jgi:post-segregation antitoxin (ccd killing protein)